MIDYLVPDFFVSPSIENNGGMHTKVERVRQATREWAIQHVSFETFTSQLTTLLKSFY